MSEAILNYFIYNNEEHKVPEFENLYFENKPSIYEVIRIIDGIPVFLEEHYDRLINSAKILNYKLKLSFDDVKKNINKMVKLNDISNFNIKIVVNALESGNPNEYYFFVNSQYPSEDHYKKGVETFLYTAERHNPNAKVINQNLRDDINKLLKEKNCYEALLVNNKGEITEGSRSNLFFVKGNKVYTAPAEDVLLGITRQRILTLCNKNNIDTLETPILADELNSYDAAFISGTSPKVLPISKIDDLKFSTTNEILIKIMKIYDDEIRNYMYNYK